MNLATMQKCGGISLMAGSVLLTVYAMAFSWLLPVKDISTDFTRLVLNQNWTWIAAVALAGVMLLMFGFIAVYSRIYAAGGLTGFLGFMFLETAYILQACKVTWELCLYPVIAKHPSAAALLRDGIIRQDLLVGIFRSVSITTIFIGIVLFCLTLVYSTEFPKAAGFLIFLGGVAYGLGPALSTGVAISGIVIHTVGCFILGARLMRKEDMYSFNIKY